MRWVFLWLCILSCGVLTVKGHDRDSVKIQTEAPKLLNPPLVLLTDSIPGTFVRRLDELYQKWYVSKPELGDTLNHVGAKGGFFFFARFHLSQSIGFHEFGYTGFV